MQFVNGKMLDVGPSDPLLARDEEEYSSPLRHKAVRNLRAFREGMEVLTPSKMLVLVLIFGSMTGVIAFVYNSFFEFVVHLAWESLPEKVISPWLSDLSAKVSWFPAVPKIAWVYTVILSTMFGTLAGLVQRWLGSPGDLPDTVANIHEQGWIPIKQSPSMFLCSTFSIAAGGSLGPEAPLLALCGASCSWFGRQVLQYRGQKLRNCALLGSMIQLCMQLAGSHDAFQPLETVFNLYDMKWCCAGMTAGLAAFFGVALGGMLATCTHMLPCRWLMHATAD